MIPYVQRAVAERKLADANFDLWVFPGMELTTRGGVQCLILFDADLSEEWRREAQARLGIVLADLDDKKLKGRQVVQLDCCYPDIAEKLDGLTGVKGRYIVLPNVSQGGKHTCLKDGSHADFKKMSYVGGYLDHGQTVETIHSVNRKRLSGTDAMWGDRYIYPLPTSDARSADMVKVGTNDCWMKLAAPTAEAVRQAFLGHQSRIRIARPGTASLSIAAIRVTGSKILEDGDLLLSSEQNVFIGGRGSGKSTYLEYIAFGLGRSCFDLKKIDYSGSERNSKLIYDTIMSAQAIIELDVLQDGAKFRISRAGSHDYEPRVTYPDGTVQSLSTKELRSMFPAVVYSQGELSELGKQAGRNTQIVDLLQFVEPAYKREDDILSGNIEAARLAVRGSLQVLAETWVKQQELHKLTLSRSSLEQRIIALEKTLPAQSDDDKRTLAHSDALSEYERRRSQASVQVSTVFNELTLLTKTADRPIDLASELEEASEFRDLYNNFVQEFAGGIAALGAKLSKIRHQITAAEERFASIVEGAKTARERVMEKLTEHRAATVQIGMLRSELEGIVAQIGTKQLRMPSPTEKMEEFERAIERLKAAIDARVQKTGAWAKQLESLSGGRIEASLGTYGEWSEIRAAVDEVSAKSGSQQSNRQTQVTEQIEDTSPWAFLDAFRSDCLAALRYKYVGSGPTDGRVEHPVLARTIGGSSKTLSQCLENMDLARVQAISTATPQPDLTLFYCDDGRRVSFEQASEGQRAAALLSILLEQPGGPLLVDQPEGDLDNKVISAITENLHSAKQRRQIIFASHNANIVVNGSSELVIGMDAADHGKRVIFCRGAIDRSDVCFMITSTMEGGEKAFRDRKNKYGY
ncbi:hypothetical protein MBLL_04066 [Methylobacterium bullatum]|uniref:ATPase AAA-type core domain-containing protein n=2 Tax=Methylobacterium bullatum TaxID=570505 RepID=A0A679KCM4_9HYPH|nr:hypothetical protein MBLL_04066 [Methylobacterium bullatum]